MDNADSAARRRRLGWILSAAVCAIYFAFLLLGAVAPQLLARSPFASGAVSIAVLLAIAVVGACAGITGFYVARARVLQLLLAGGIAALALIAGHGDALAAGGRSDWRSASRRARTFPCFFS